jgi:hypothetical protein
MGLLIWVARARRHDQELPVGGKPTARRYRLILLHEGRRAVEFESERELGLGDRLDFEGRAFEVVGLTWRGGGALLCTPIGPATLDEPIQREQARYLGQWRDD